VFGAAGDPVLVFVGAATAEEDVALEEDVDPEEDGPWADGEDDALQPAITSTTASNAASSAIPRRRARRAANMGKR
jgi:hypothetical protein